MISLSLLSLLLLNTVGEAQQVMSIQVREGQLRTTPSHLGKFVARLSYGDRVTVIAGQGAWKKVSLTDGKYQGWVHETALTSKRIILKAGQSDVGTSVSRDEIALAGKGFNEEVEAQYRKNNINIDYNWINKMEAIKVSPEQMENFIRTGQLAQGLEGGKP